MTPYQKAIEIRKEKEENPEVKENKENLELAESFQKENWEKDSVTIKYKNNLKSKYEDLIINAISAAQVGNDDKSVRLLIRAGTIKEIL